MKIIIVDQMRDDKMTKGETHKVVGSKQGTISHHKSEKAAQTNAKRQNRLWKGKESFTVEPLKKK